MTDFRERGSREVCDGCEVNKSGGGCSSVRLDAKNNLRRRESGG